MRPTVRHRREHHYLRSGGPWDVGSLDEVLRAAAPRQDLLVDGRLRLSSATVDELVARLAGGLRARGVRRRDAVAWQLPNRQEAVLLYRACWRLGAVAAPLHHQAGEAEVRRLLDRFEPRLVVAGGHLPAATHPGALVAPEHFANLLDAEPTTDPAARPGDLAVVLFTSGSSGEPKGVLHTHRALAYKARLMAVVHGLTSNDAVLMPAPLAHVSGLLNGVLLPGVVPMKTVLMERWDAVAALDVIARERITFMIGPPTFFVSLMAATGFSSEAVASLRLVSCGGAGVTPAFVETAAARLGCRVKRTYGSTEAPTVTTSAAGDDPERGKVTDGRATGEVELRIASDGELQVRGPELFVGYADPGHNDAAFARGGWFRTGDRAAVDGDGWLTVLGRIADVIIRGGENIAAAEVEAVLEAHPGVAQAVAVGEPDERLGERVTAFVVVAVAADTFDLEECRTWFARQGVARFKTPERVVVLDQLPTLPAGKPDRAALREVLLSPPEPLDR